MGFRQPFLQDLLKCIRHAKLPVSQSPDVHAAAPFEAALRPFCDLRLPPYIDNAHHSKDSGAKPARTISSHWSVSRPGSHGPGCCPNRTRIQIRIPSNGHMSKNAAPRPGGRGCQFLIHPFQPRFRNPLISSGDSFSCPFLHSSIFSRITRTPIKMQFNGKRQR